VCPFFRIFENVVRVPCIFIDCLAISNSAINCQESRSVPGNRNSRGNGNSFWATNGNLNNIIGMEMAYVYKKSGFA